LIVAGVKTTQSATSPFRGKVKVLNARLRITRATLAARDE
jgi:hypothetical protein